MRGRHSFEATTVKRKRQLEAEAGGHNGPSKCLVMAADSMEIDDALYSRQRYVLGDTAMHKMAQSHVFLSGMGGLGVEIAKNIVLAGIKALTIHDTKQCKTWDLGTNFFAREDDVLN
ncbi:ubiquitin-like modifier-activating enzyme 6, partial [Crotalus adamanteus]